MIMDCYISGGEAQSSSMAWDIFTSAKVFGTIWIGFRRHYVLLHLLLPTVFILGPSNE